MFLIGSIVGRMTRRRLEVVLTCCGKTRLVNWHSVMFVNWASVQDEGTNCILLWLGSEARYSVNLVNAFLNTTNDADLDCT